MVKKLIDYNEPVYREVSDLAISFLVLGLCFSIGYITTGNYDYALASFIGIGIGFISHELAHRYVARVFYGFSRYRAWYLGLLLSLVTAITTRGKIVFAAPGAVEVALPWYSPRAEASISISGPAINLAVSFLCLILSNLLWSPQIIQYTNIVGYINAYLAFFNLLPIPPLDGFKAVRSSILLWLMSFSLSVIMLIIYLRLY